MRAVAGEKTAFAYSDDISDAALLDAARTVRSIAAAGQSRRVKVGTQVTWVNNGRLNHTVSAEDGSWTTGSLAPLEAGAVTFDKPGTYTYICKDHPWAKAQLIVEP